MVGVTGLECKVKLLSVFIWLLKWRFYAIFLIWGFSWLEIV